MTALDGIRVLDISQGVPGPFCTKFLASFGASVTKVEPLDGEPGRRLAPLASDEAGETYSPFFLYLNTGKLGLAIDAGSDAGVAVLRRLAALSDVIVTSSEAGAHPLGLSPAELAEAAPAALVVSVSAYGEDGPWADRRSNDLLTYAQSGWASVTGEPERAPLKGSGYQASFQAGIAAVMTVLAGLLQRQRDGVGQCADVAMLDALAVTFAPALLQAQFNGRDNTRRAAGFPVGPVPAKDGYFVLTTSRAHFWRDAMNELGLHELAEDERFSDPSARQELYSEVAPLVEERIGKRGRAELFHKLGVLRVPSGMVVEVDEMFDNEQLRARGFFETPPPGGFPELAYPGAPFELSATPWLTPRGAPRIGEHSDKVLRRAGFAPLEIAALRESKVIA
ncbi:CoA transferase [bacterium]|nr:CoA transferase [bacterium]